MASLNDFTASATQRASHYLGAAAAFLRDRATSADAHLPDRAAHRVADYLAAAPSADTQKALVLGLLVPVLLAVLRREYRAPRRGCDEEARLSRLPAEYHELHHLLAPAAAAPPLAAAGHDGSSAGSVGSDSGSDDGSEAAEDERPAARRVAEEDAVRVHAQQRDAARRRSVADLAANADDAGYKAFLQQLLEE